MPSSNALPAEWVKRLWQRLSDAYGRQFIAQFASESDLESWRETWGEGLAGLEAAHIAHGLKLMAQRDNAFPPSLGEFSTMARAYREPLEVAKTAELPERASPERAREFAQAAEGLLRRPKQQWWTPESVVNDHQRLFIIAQARHFGRESRAGRFLEDCIEAGKIGREYRETRVREPGEDLVEDEAVA